MPKSVHPNLLRINLRLQLLLSIGLAALVCLLVTAYAVLYQSERQTQAALQTTAEALQKQLGVQLMRLTAGFEDPKRFPDLDLWKETRMSSGICVHFEPVKLGTAKSICRDAGLPVSNWPHSFANCYRFLFKSEQQVTRSIEFNNHQFGLLTVSSSLDAELAQAWNNFRALIALTLMIVVVLTGLVYWLINRALQPAQQIVSSLKQMRAGDLSVRLPNFAIDEWQETGLAINALGETLQQLLNERQRLTLQLLTLQEDERHYLARELHDELGQCLAAINAIAVSITQTAKQECPVLLTEAEHLSRVNQHMMNTVRAILKRLRPPELEELGLAACLDSLLAEWKVQTANKFQCQLLIEGECSNLPEPLPINLYRIVQECLTNIAKHSTAKAVHIELAVGADALALQIQDDGAVENLPLSEHSGLGLAGIRERAALLGGEFCIEHSQPGGLAVLVKIPLMPMMTKIRPC